MESKNDQVVIYPPNRPLEREFGPSKEPILYQHIFCMDVNTKGQFLTSSSNITGSYWEGTLFFYQDELSLTQHNYSNYFITNSPISDGKFFREEMILLAEDVGGLRVLKIHSDEKTPLKCETVFDTVEGIEKLAVWKNSDNIISCIENSIQLWTLTDDAKSHPKHEYKHYHTDTITDIDVHNSHGDIFASVSTDRKAVVWDARLSINPASVLYINEFSSLTAVAWNKSNSNLLAVGSEAGDVYLLDTRQPKEFVSVANGFDGKVHRLKFNDSTSLAAAGNSPGFLVLECKEDSLLPIYKNRVHKGFVRDFSWYNNVLYSCGFDGKILKHNVSDSF